MNTAKLVNSALTGGGLIYPENLNVVIGNESKGYPKGTVLDANATLTLVGASGAVVPGAGSTPGTGGTSGTSGGTGTNPGTQNTQSALEGVVKLEKHGNTISGKPIEIKNIVASSRNDGYVTNVMLEAYKLKSDVLTNNVSSNSSVTVGYLNSSYGSSNIIIGSGVISFSSSFGNFLSGSHVTFKVVKHTENDKLRIEIPKDSILEYAIKKNLLPILNNFAINVVDGWWKIIKISDSDIPDRNTYNFTRIDDKVIEINNPNVSKFRDYDRVIARSVYTNSSSSIVSGSGIECNGSYSLYAGMALASKLNSSNNGPNSVACLGIGNTVSNDGEFACGKFNISSNGDMDADGFKYSTIFSVGGGDVKNSFNIIECVLRSKKEITTNIKTEDVYIKGIGDYDGKNAADSNTRSLQQVISDIETAVSINSNGPWDVDITSEFVNGNVTIKPLSMWSISQNVKRVYFTADLKQGDVITIPDNLRMYIGWKISDNRFGMADWATAGKKYTVTTDSYYVILIATENDNPGVQTNNLPSFGKVILRTSNPEFKPTLQTDAKKDHTNDDLIMRSIAHQGFHKTEIANSLAAFRAAAKEGWRYVETDTYMTKDGKFIVSHDDNIPVGYTNGTTTLTDTSYKYKQHTLDEILAFHGPNGEKVDTLEDFCKLCKECGLHPYIEIKQGNMWQANTIDTTNAKYNGKPYAIKLLDIVNRYGLRGNATFISSTPYTLRLMAQKDQSYRYGIVYFGQLKITDTNLTTLISKIEEFNNDTDASKAYLFVDVNIDNLKTADANIANLFVSRNCALEVWTAKTKEDLDNLDPYVTGVTSDNIHAGEILAKKI